MKKVIIGFCVAFAAITSQAEYLWWNVSDDETSGTLWGYLENELKIDYRYVYAKIVVTEKDDKGKTSVVTSYNLSPFTYEWGTGTDAAATSVSMTAVLGDDYENRESYSYYIEIMSSKDGSKLGYNTEATTYAQMNSSFTDSAEPVGTVPTIWHGGSGTYKAAPEPTSAMLMLIGVAGLALRRKQRKA